MIQLTAPIFIVYGFLTATILSVWLPRSFNETTRIPVWMMLFGITALLGIYHGFVEPGGVLYLIWLGLCCHMIRLEGLSRYFRMLAGFVVIVLVAGLFLHKAPFFSNPLVFDGFYFSEHSSAYYKHWNFDKAAAGAILLGYFGDVSRTMNDWKKLDRKTFIVSFITIALSLVLAFLVGYIKFDLTFTPAFFVWAWANLFFTCMSEEALFRGFILKYLLLSSDRRRYKYKVVILVGLLFGLAHFSGGTTYILLATVAGTGYGLVYFLSGRIESAILTHFILNVLHLLFFTYPYAGLIE